jgi:cytochrome c-type biogenesis protein CcsB
MESAYLIRNASYIYLLSTIIYILYTATRNNGLKIASHFITLIGFGLNTLGIIFRWIESYRLGIGHVPLANFYESLIFFSWGIILIYGIILWKYRLHILGTFVVPIAFILLAYGAHLTRAEIRPLIPALQSDWLIIHVVTSFLGYAAFSSAFGVSILYLILEKKGDLSSKINAENRLISLKELLDEVNYKSIAIGFTFLSLGIITGAAWANEAWGSYWSWDPKETWSLITWFIYASFLHARIVRGWRGRRTALLSIGGFGAVIFTYLGVNFILSGLHSYA